jgi:3-oxoacyl-[acyl-carrier protein] reductase
MFIVVTGASKGIGFELVKLLAQNKHTVLAIARNAKELDKLKKLSPKNILTINGDVTLASTQTEVLALVKKQTKTIDVLINNAGTLVNKPFQNIKASELQTVFNVNVFAPFLLTQILIPFMGKKNKGHIVNIGSIGGVQGASKFSGLSAYSSSKGALAILTECLALELKPLNIFCNCLALGAVQTEMLDKAFPGYKAPLNPKQMAEFIVNFSLTGHTYFNGKIIPVSLSTP